MCDYVIRNETMDMAEIMPGGSGPVIHNAYCPRPSAFWVQSVMSTHNMHCCAQHLARIVREIETISRTYDLLDSNNNGNPGPDMRFLRKDSRTGNTNRITREESNYAHVTVKPVRVKGN